MGKGAAKKSEQLLSESANRYSQMAQQLMGESQPQRKQVGDYYSGIITGGPELQRVAAPEISFIKRQYKSAQDRLRDVLPAGGQKTRAMSSLIRREPGEIAASYQRRIEDALARLSNLATFSTQGTLSATGGIGASGDSLAQLAAARGGAVGSAVGGLANLLGFALGGGFGAGR